MSDDRNNSGGAKRNRRTKVTAEVCRGLAADGLSKSKAARLFGVSPQAVDDMAVRHCIAFKDGRDAANKARRVRS
jgi:hypothetical protein